MKALIPAAGLGTRLLPLTKSVPKELLPVNGKPMLQWVLEEALEAGLREVVVVVSPAKKALRDWLMPVSEGHPLSNQPGLRGLESLLKSLEITFVEQTKALGMGDAIVRSREALGEAPFALLLPDNVCSAGSSLTERLLELYDRHGKSCVALRPAEGESLAQGRFVVESGEGAVRRIHRVLPKGQGPSGTGDFFGIGRCILGSEVFGYLESLKVAGEHDDGPLFDALARDGRLLGLVMEEEEVHHYGAGEESSALDPSVLEEWRDSWKLSITGHASIWNLHRTLRGMMKAKWNRALPFGDELFDRWERARFLGFGHGASIYDTSIVLGDVKVGEGTWVGPFTVLDGRGGLQIGRFCSIAAGVQIYTHDTVEWALTGGKAQEKFEPTRIGNCCYIGPMSVVGRGITIGDHSVVGANSFVKDNVPPSSIVGGSPARLLGRVELVGEKEVRFIYDNASPVGAL